MAFRQSVIAMESLLDVPSALWVHHIGPCLGLRELCSLSQTCRHLRALVEQDALWQQQCEDWLATQRSPHNGLDGATTQDLRAGLQLPSHRTLCQVLHAMGSWLGGVWYATNQEALPRGMLLLARLHPATASLRLVEVRPRALVVLPADAQRCWDLNPKLELQVSSMGTQATLALTSASSGLCSVLQLARDGQALTVHRGLAPLRVGPAPGMRTIPSRPGQPGPMDAAVASLGQWLGVRSAAVHLESLQFRRAQLAPHPQACGAAEEQEAPGMALLRPFEGLWTGSYGPHGLEVLQLQASSSPDTAPPLCPIVGSRLQGLKLLGDPNVPALKYSFVADASACKLGPYDPQQDDPFAPGQGLARPVVAFFEAATTVVDLAARPVRARFTAVGQINHVPSLWQPRWVPAQLLLYEAPMDRLLTLVFLDEGEPFCHAIDLNEFPFAAGNFVSSDL